jgi:hypothetical protein
MMLPYSSKEKLPSSDRALSDSGGRDPLVAVCVMAAAVIPTSPVERAHPQWRRAEPISRVRSGQGRWEAG